MARLGIVWLVHAETGSFGMAGLVTGAFAAAETVVGPQAARLMDRFGKPRVLVPLLCAHAGAIVTLVALALTGAPVVPLMAAGLAAGATVPQFGALSVARWSALLHGRAELAPAFALETISNDVAFLLGPALAVLTATQLHPAAGTVLAGALVVGAGLAFATLRRTAPAPTAVPALDRADARGPGTLRTRSFATLLVVSLALGVFFGSKQVSVSAFVDAHHGSTVRAGARRLRRPAPRPGRNGSPDLVQPSHAHDGHHGIPTAAGGGRFGRRRALTGCRGRPVPLCSTPAVRNETRGLLSVDMPPAEPPGSS